MDAAGGLGHARTRRRRRPDLTAHQSASCFAAIEITSGLGSLFAGRAMRLGDPQRTVRPIPATSHHQLTAIELQLGVSCGPVHQSNPALPEAYTDTAIIEITSGLGPLFAGRAMRLGDPQRTVRPIPATSHHQLTAIELQLGVSCGPVHQSNPALPEAYTDTAIL